MLKEQENKLKGIIKWGDENCRNKISEAYKIEEGLFKEYLEEANRDLQLANDKMGPIDPIYPQRIDEFRANYESLQKRIQDVAGKTSDLRALIACKVVHDKLRLDGFLRNVEAKFNIFNEPNSFNVTAEQVEINTARVQKLEEELLALCPLVK